MPPLRPLLLGWNDNTLAILHAIRGIGLAIDHVLLPPDYGTKKLVRTCRQHLIPFFVWDRGYAPSGFHNLLISASWPYKIPSGWYSELAFGGINVHGSLLPRYRGPHPIPWALVHDEKEMGITVHRLAENWDSGDILGQASFKVTDTMTHASIRNRTHLLGGEVLVRILAQISAGKAIVSRQQNEQSATHAPRRNPKDNRIDWTLPARSLFCFIRAMGRPWQGAHTYLDGQRVTIWAAHLSKLFCEGTPGQVVDLTARGAPVICTCDRKGLILRKFEGPMLRPGDQLL